jgi:hypothetical protein
MPVRSVVAIAALVCLPAQAFAQGATSAVGEKLPDDGRVHVNAYLGMEFVTLTRDFEQFQFKGLSRQPYVLKVGDFHLTGLGPFDARINAAVTSLLAAGGFAKDQPAEKPDLGQAERYAAILGWAIGKTITLHAEARYARMVTVAAPNFESSANFARTTYYVPSSGPARRLLLGDSVATETTWYTLAVTADIDGKAIGQDWLNHMNLGYRMLRMSIPTAYGITHGSSTATSEFLALVDDTVTCHSASFNVVSDQELFGDVHFGGEIHGGLGYAVASSALFSSSHGACVNYGGTLALKYAQPAWNLVIGYHYDEVAALVSDSNLTLSQTLLYSENLQDGRVRTAPAGSGWNVARVGYSTKTLAPFARFTVSF